MSRSRARLTTKFWSAHETPIHGKKRAVNHIFSLNLRTHSLHYIDLCNVQGKQKKEHEIKKHKSLEMSALRMGAPTGIKVIHAYDPAIVDYGFWRKCKQNGVYFILNSEVRGQRTEVSH